MRWAAGESSLAAASLAEREGQLELTGPVEADGHGEEHVALGIAVGDVSVAMRPGLGEIGGPRVAEPPGCPLREASWTS